MTRLVEFQQRIKSQDNRFGSFLYLPERARQETTSGELADVVVAIKDNIMTRNWPTTAASKILEGHVAAYDATVVRKLLEAGATLIGKTNLDEFAMGGSTENSAYQLTKNPWDTKLVPGGSSGGSAVAVAADFCDASLGSDTGGSIRQPAAFCGLTGLKPTYGSVSRYGLIALASSLDVIGPMARSAATVEKIFSAISGQDKFDQTTRDYSYQPTEIDFAQLRIGLPTEAWELEIDPEITASVKEFVAWLRSKGAEIIDVSLPSLPLALPTYYIILPAEASANLARFDGVRYRASRRQDGSLLETYLNTRQLFGSEVKRRILLGTFVLSVGHYDEYYSSALRVVSKIKSEYDQVFRQVDCLVSAVTPTPPFALGSRTSDPLKMYQTDLLTVSANLAGVPAISLPCGQTKAGLPIGVQVTANIEADNLLLALGKAYQAETKHHFRQPKEADGA